VHQAAEDLLDDLPEVVQFACNLGTAGNQSNGQLIDGFLDELDLTNSSRLYDQAATESGAGHV